MQAWNLKILTRSSAKKESIHVRLDQKIDDLAWCPKADLSGVWRVFGKTIQNHLQSLSTPWGDFV